MRINGLTTTNLRRHMSAIYIIKELLNSKDEVNHSEVVDVLMGVYFGLEDIHGEIEKIYQAECQERAKNMGNP